MKDINSLRYFDSTTRGKHLKPPFMVFHIDLPFPVLKDLQQIFPNAEYHADACFVYNYTIDKIHPRALQALNIIEIKQILYNAFI